MAFENGTIGCTFNVQPLLSVCQISSIVMISRSLVTSSKTLASSTISSSLGTGQRDRGSGVRDREGFAVVGFDSGHFGVMSVKVKSA